MGLFQFGDFLLASGKKSNFKIECDALTQEDWEAVAAIIAPKLPKFGIVIGVPRGGLMFAEALRKYQDKWCSTFLYVDDVWTTGNSMLRIVNQRAPWSGVVLFARGPVPDHVHALFQLNEDLQ
jgi:orotate phosphoribosyltransferase